MVLVKVLRLSNATLAAQIELSMILVRVAINASAITVAVVAVIRTFLAGEFIIVSIVASQTSRIAHLVDSEVVPCFADRAKRRVGTQTTALRT